MKTPRKALVADLALFSVAIFWGFNFVVIKNVTERLTHTVAAYGQGVVAATMLYLFFRYVVATLIFSGIQPHALLRATRRQWGMGGLLGGFYLTALVVQTIGLQYTTPGKSGFITGLSVAMVPFLYWAVARRSPGWFQALGAIVATAGLGILSLRGNLTVSWGDALTLLGALLYALHIMTTGFFAPKVPPSTLAVTQMAVSPFCSSPSRRSSPTSLWRSAGRPGWRSSGRRCRARSMRSSSSPGLSATRPRRTPPVLLCFESVFAAVSGVIFGMDTVTLRMISGASLIFTGTHDHRAAAGRRRRERGAGRGPVPIPADDARHAAPEGPEGG